MVTRFFRDTRSKLKTEFLRSKSSDVNQLYFHLILLYSVLSIVISNYKCFATLTIVPPVACWMLATVLLKCSSSFSSFQSSSSRNMFSKRLWKKMKYLLLYCRVHNHKSDVLVHLSLFLRTLLTAWPKVAETWETGRKVPRSDVYANLTYVIKWVLRLKQPKKW